MLDALGLERVNAGDDVDADDDGVDGAGDTEAKRPVAASSAVRTPATTGEAVPVDANAKDSDDDVAGVEAEDDDSDVEMTRLRAAHEELSRIDPLPPRPDTEGVD